MTREKVGGVARGRRTATGRDVSKSRNYIDHTLMLGPRRPPDHIECVAVVMHPLQRMYSLIKYNGPTSTAASGASRVAPSKSRTSVIIPAPHPPQVPAPGECPLEIILTALLNYDGTLSIPTEQSGSRP